MATLDKAAHPSLAEWVERRARETPRAIAYRSPHDSASWLDYHERSQRLARLIAAERFAPGDRVAVMLPDGPGVHAAVLGLFVIPRLVKRRRA